MRKTWFALLIALLGAAFNVAHAADAPLAADARGARDARVASLYEAFGGKAGIASLMTDFVGRLKTDVRIGRYFNAVKPQALAESLTEQLCQLSGGPCDYEGGPMKPVHQDLDIDRAAFHALVEVLQDAMSARGIAFGDQNRMLALLAPMHRDIVTQ